jgi:signal transduction histidine kinase
MADVDLTVEGLVHDLNNVFETIQDSAELLSKDPKYARLAATLRRVAARGSRILSSYLEHSQAGLELEQILGRAIEFARDSLLAARGPQFEFRLYLEPGLRLRGHPAAWERVFANLFLNAAQAKADDGEVEVRAARGPSGIEVTVRDDGPGISPQNLPRILEARFSTRAKRSGLGLHIARTIVEQNGGTISASNVAGGHGAQFKIVLPLVAATAAGES